MLLRRSSLYAQPAAGERVHALAGVGTVGTQSSIMEEPVKLIGYGAVFYMLYKWLAGAAKKKVENIRQASTQKRKRKKMRKAKRLAEKIEDLGYHASIQEPQYYDEEY